MKLYFVYAGKTIEFNVIYSRRKTIKIAIEAPDNIIVSAPIGVSQILIINCVKEKAPWILKKIYMFKNMEIKAKHEFKSEEIFLYLGEKVKLQLKIGKGEEKVRLEGDTLEVKVLEENKDLIRNALELWYREKTLETVVERVKYYQRYFHEIPRNIRVKQQKRRWASCTYYNDLLFNWRCSMAKGEVIDYIVVHEMCHMVHKDHSKNFWSLVASILPNYHLQEEWLKINGIDMEL
ncbi:M48 family metallopeptidase [Clostridium akagii]|uniref:M48 family metallopeptidase n=1 Tax=Clostridium akagii TaxID=91623 RepID=UPI00047BD2F3|nr:SprT family zinc-dependent metalloprotease [Clostridium akagii]